MKQPIARLAILLCLLVVSAGAVAQDQAAQQIASALPKNTERLEATSAPVVNYALLLSAAEKVGRELRFDRALTLSGERSRTLWKLPAGAEIDDVFDTAAAELGGEELFRCAGRGCGRSTAWANLIYAEPLVVGQDRYQRYVVYRTSPREVQSLYAIRRGNQRVNLLHEVVRTGEQTVNPESSGPSSELARNGFARLALVPGRDGLLDADALRGLEKIGAQLAGARIGEIYVVCHLYDMGDTKRLIEQSATCANAAQDALQEGYLVAERDAPAAPQTNRRRPPAVTFVAFGAGPLLPRLRAEKPLGSRLELVAPARLRQP